MVGIRNATIVTVKPLIPNYAKAILGPCAFGIEPPADTEYRRPVMTKRTHEEVIEAHRIAIGATKIHVDYNLNSDPEELAKELERGNNVIQMFNAIDPLTKAEAKIERYEKLLRSLTKLGQASFDEWDKMSEGETLLRQKLFGMTEFATHENTKHTIEFAKRKGVIS
jgi:hypothetical protein